MIKSHKNLAEHIRGKKILHLNSLGKDALICLDWLNKYAKCEVVSIYFKLASGYIDDDLYFNYLKKIYPNTKFVEFTCVPEINEILLCMFQSPVYINHVINKLEYTSFNFKKVIEEKRVEYGCDYISSGISCYEGMGRAMYLKRNGLCNEKKKTIYPIGLMKQKQVMGILKNLSVKLNPSYKFAESTFDSASYFKMRSAFIAKEKYKNKVYKYFPLLALDEYRYEVLLEKK